MSMFSTACSNVTPGFAIVSRNGYRLMQTRSMGRIPCSVMARTCSGLSRSASNPPWMFRVKRLDPSVHHFRKSGHLRNIENVQTGVAQEPGGSAGGKKLNTELPSAGR
ncbi:MAG: hypothetical protein KatS3mg104_0176 [Phycisphaerae bacterium]|nr:MAG: hypothetical protein KatS3mg104_0176 [Phycisphaerae bacterium]